MAGSCRLYSTVEWRPAARPLPPQSGPYDYFNVERRSQRPKSIVQIPNLVAWEQNFNGHATSHESHLPRKISFAGWQHTLQQIQQIIPQSDNVCVSHIVTKLDKQT